jgi:hypothetical protein
MINNLKIQADGIIEEFRVRPGDILTDLQKEVGNKLSQILMSGGRVMLVDEEAVEKRLEPNIGASNLVGRQVRGSAVIIKRDTLWRSYE